MRESAGDVHVTPVAHQHAILRRIRPGHRVVPRGVVRPRVYYESGAGASMFLTGGVIAEDRAGGTLGAATAPDGAPFAERLETRRADVGGLGRWLLGSRVLTARGSFSSNGQDRYFGDVRERGTRQTAFGEVSLTGASGAHSGRSATAFQQDRYPPEDVSRFAYTFSAPALFVQDQMDLGDRTSLSGSARVDVHDEYGVLSARACRSSCGRPRHGRCACRAAAVRSRRHRSPKRPTRRVCRASLPSRAWRPSVRPRSPAT